jgi:hypothetical protein
MMLSKDATGARALLMTATAHVAGATNARDMVRDAVAPDHSDLTCAVYNGAVRHMAMPLMDGVHLASQIATDRLGYGR